MIANKKVQKLILLQEDASVTDQASHKPECRASNAQRTVCFEQDSEWANNLDAAFQMLIELAQR